MKSFQYVRIKKWLFALLARPEFVGKEVLTDNFDEERNLDEINEDTIYFSQICELEDKNLDRYRSLARRLSGLHSIQIESKSFVIRYKGVLTGFTYEVVSRDERVKVSSGYVRAGWRMRDREPDLTFTFAQHELEYGRCS